MELLQAVLHGLTTAFTFLIVITVLIAVHELGHYWFAKMCGMHVTAFAVMVGGIRKTPLESYLHRPLVKNSVLWLVGSLIAIATGLAGFYEQRIAFYIGLAFFATLGPLWIISRLNALYHRPLKDGVLNMLKCYAVVLLILAIGTRFQNVDIVYALSMLIGAASIAVMLAYYYPVIRTGGADPNDPAVEAAKQESPFAEGEGNKGHGEIVANQEPIRVRFRPVLTRTDKHGTEFSLLLLPLGGFASIYGMQAREDGSEIHEPRGFFSKSPLKRLMVLFAGPLFSILLGVLLLFTAFYGEGEQQLSNIVDKVTKDSASAGILKPGDKIIAINEKPVSDFWGLHTLVRFSYTEADGKLISNPLKVTVDRAGETKTFEIKPDISNEKKSYLISNKEESKDKKHLATLGVNLKQTFVPLTAPEAAVRALEAPIVGVKHIYQVFTNYEVAKASVGGPGAMVEQTSMAVESGFWTVLFLAGSLSLVLGLMNLLPFPPLDGGQMVIAFVEMLRGNKRLPHSLQVALHNIGGMAVMLLMLAAFTLDATRRSEARESEKKTAVESKKN